MPEISVIIPIYKIEKYLTDCLDSILVQTFQDYEVIMVDDGSPDECGKICDQYVLQDKRFRVIHKKNAGLSCARNTGIDAAKGKYLCFIDGDDILHPEFCEVLYDLIKDTKCDFSACAVCRFQDGKNPEPVISNSTSVKMGNVEYLNAQLDREKEFGVWNRLYRREVFDDLCFYPGKIHEDVIFSTDLALLQGGVMTTDQELYYYRQRQTGIVAEGSRKCSPDRIFAGEYLVKKASTAFPDLYLKCLRYAIDYPWMFVDKIYVDRSFAENKEFLNQLRQMIRTYKRDIENLDELNSIIQNRMQLFAKSKILYGINAYSRLIRVYLFRILGKDAYEDGHGI